MTQQQGLKNLHCLRNLQTLDLSHSHVLSSLGTLSQCAQLQNLSLERCKRIPPRELADAVPRVRGLRVLDLSQCQASLLRLHELPRHLPSLCTLVLHGTDINEEQLQLMRHRAPQIDIAV